MEIFLDLEYPGPLHFLQILLKVLIVNSLVHLRHLSFFYYKQLEEAKQHLRYFVQKFPQLDLI